MAGGEALEALRKLVGTFVSLIPTNLELEKVLQGHFMGGHAFSRFDRPEEQSRLTLSLADPVLPVEFAELLIALDTIHRELGGGPLRDLVAKIGLPEETRVV